MVNKFLNSGEKEKTKALNLYKMVILSFMFLSLFSFVSAVSPFQSGGNLIVEYSKIDTVQFEQSHTFHFHVFNETSFITDANGQCGFTWIYPNGSVAYKNNDIPFYLENEWEVTLTSGNFSILKDYSFITECNTSSQVGFASGGINVTANGELYRDVPLEFYIILFGLLMIVFSAFNKKLGILEQIGGIIFLIMGVVTIYPGYNFINYTNLLGMLLGTVLIASGAYFFIWGQLRKRIEKQEGDED